MEKKEILESQDEKNERAGREAYVEFEKLFDELKKIGTFKTKNDFYVALGCKDIKVGAIKTEFNRLKKGMKFSDKVIDAIALKYPNSSFHRSVLNFQSVYTKRGEVSKLTDKLAECYTSINTSLSLENYKAFVDDKYLHIPTVAILILGYCYECLENEELVNWVDINLDNFKYLFTSDINGQADFYYEKEAYTAIATKVNGSQIITTLLINLIDRADVCWDSMPERIIHQDKNKKKIDSYKCEIACKEENYFRIV